MAGITRAVRSLNDRVADMEKQLENNSRLVADLISRNMALMKAYKELAGPKVADHVPVPVVPPSSPTPAQATMKVKGAHQPTASVELTTPKA